MSLSGLDDAAVVEAYQASLAEAGGWFLLKYASRDTVTLLARGTGGVVETRQAVEEYEEKSPLYGVVQYRRKKFILKYVPEGTSRILQVRLTVQFQSVLDAFSPYETIFSFNDAAELSEAALGTSAMLGTRAGSMKSSSSSLRRQRLGEITEHTEEGPGTLNTSKRSPPATAASHADEDGKGGKSSPLSTSQLSGDIKRTTAVTTSFLPTAKPLLDIPHLSAPAEFHESLESSIQTTLQQVERPTLTTPDAVTATRTDKSLPATPQPTPPHTRQGNGDLESSDVAADRPTTADKDEDEDTQTRDSIQQPRPSLAETDRGSEYSYAASYLTPKPKQKRAPRPHVESQSRPKTSASAKSAGASRPVANLPTSLQVSHRNHPPSSYRPDSQHSSKSVPARFGNTSTPETPPPLPSPVNFHIASLYKAPQQPPSQQRPPLAVSLMPSATPEKLRLMKALQMRKRNLQTAQRSSTYPSPASERSLTPSSNGMDQERLEKDREAARNSANPRSSPTERKHEADLAGKETPVSSIPSPISTSQPSEKPSSRSSFTDENEKPSIRSSISSDTGSSVTPRANLEEEAPDKKSQQSPDNAQANDASLESTETAEASDESKRLTLVPTKPTDILANGDMKSQELNSEANTSSEAQRDEATSRPSLALRNPSKSSMTRRDRKRRGVLDPLQIMSSPDPSEVSEDESLMEGLEHAKFEEAKPMSVARPPATPIFSRGSSDRLKELSRLHTAPSHGTTHSIASTPDRPKTGSTRSISSNLPQWPPSREETPPVPLAKKGALSQGISKRIKALEVFTSRESGSSPTSPKQSTGARGLLGLASMRKRSSFLPNQHPPNVSTTGPPRDLSVNGDAMTTDGEVSEVSTPRAQPWVQRQGSMTEVNAPSQKGESISVTARIVRTGKSGTLSVSHDPSEPVQMNLYRSPLTVERERPETSLSKPPLSRDISFQSIDSSRSPRERGRFSFTSHRSNSQTRLHTSDSMASRMSTASTQKRNGTLPKSTSETSSVDGERKDSRSSRLKKRMSILTMSSRRSLVSAFSPKAQKNNQSVATIEESNETQSIVESDMTSLSHVVDVGDVNVQFPDTLLWKRRYMRIDDQGYVIFSPPIMDQKALHSSRNISRKFHLTDFKKPALPDIERQEMAWSIRMELDDGSCVQCACESKEVQGRVLKVLVNAHTAYHQLYAN